MSSTDQLRNNNLQVTNSDVEISSIDRSRNTNCHDTDSNVSITSRMDSMDISRNNSLEENENVDNLSFVSRQQINYILEDYEDFP